MSRLSPGSCSRSRRSRRLGATWTILVIVVSTSLLAGASMYLRAATHPLQLASDQAREARLREAAFSGIRWAVLEAKARGAGAEGGTTLQLAWGSVEVKFRPVEAGATAVTVTSLARAAEGHDVLRIAGVLSPRDGALALRSFSVE